MVSRNKGHFDMEQSVSLNPKTVLDALREVHDPEIPINIVDLGLVYQVKIIDDWVGVKMTLTSPGCGLADQIANNVRERILRIPGVADADVRLIWQPVWIPSMMSEDAKKKLRIVG